MQGAVFMIQGRTLIQIHFRDIQGFCISVYVNLTSIKINAKGASNSFNQSSSRDWKKGVSGAESQEAGTQGSDARVLGAGSGVGSASAVCSGQHCLPPVPSLRSFGG